MATELEKELGVLARLKVKLEKEEAKYREVKSEYEDQRTKVLGLMNKEHVESIKTNKGIASIYTTTTVELTDPNKFFNYVARNRAFDLLQRRINTKAWKERIEAGKRVPGTEPKRVRNLRFTLAK